MSINITDLLTSGNFILMATVLLLAAGTLFLSVLLLIWKLTDDSRAKTVSFANVMLKFATFFLELLMGGQIALWVMNIVSMSPAKALIYFKTFYMYTDSIALSDAPAKIDEILTSTSVVDNMISQMGGIALTALALAIVTTILICYKDGNLAAKKSRKARVREARREKKAAKKARKEAKAKVRIEAAEKKKAEAEAKKTAELIAKVEQEVMARVMAESEAAARAKAEAIADGSYVPRRRREE